ncbi:hypothetical protein Taro_049449 [Colocasia esculenta]|uniref:RING-CH-type domain-containing protein n=1 Tax=Colocasia esculenta TaxID=4460 RepID=A0A843XAZ9_COLES|nr:hypothetical protein [Colocasia esculenta]
MIECRICQEEGEEGDMEVPCACTGTIKTYAPNYSIPPSRAIQDCLTIDIRQGWGPQIELGDPHFLAIAAAQQQLLQAEYEDFSGANSSGILCCRSLALMLMLLLLVRHALLITGQSATLQDASAFSNVSLLQLAGFILPVYIISRSCYSFLCRRRRQH